MSSPTLQQLIQSLATQLADGTAAALESREAAPWFRVADLEVQMPAQIRFRPASPGDDDGCRRSPLWVHLPSLRVGGPEGSAGGLGLILVGHSDRCPPRPCRTPPRRARTRQARPCDEPAAGGEPSPGPRREAS